MLDFRSALRSALADMSAEGGRLRCEYLSESAEFCDAENVLLYNVGMTSFARLVQRGLTFERSSSPQPACPEQLAGPVLHYQRYMTSADQNFSHWRGVEIVAAGEANLPERPERVAEWWWAVRTGPREWGCTVIAGQPFGIRVRLLGSRRSVAPAIKPMLDGLISALHDDPAPSPDAIRRLAHKLDVHTEAVRHQLVAASSPLGPRPLVRPFRDGVQWNPADDRCTACSIENDSAGLPTIRWELLRVSPT